MDDEGVMTCIRCKLPCVVFVFSESHRDVLRQQLVKRVWGMFRSEGSDLYQAGLVDIIGSSKEGEDEEKTR
eukprot:14580545-Alexandrium_andersonii.AAC.1